MQESKLRLRLGTRTSKLALWQTTHIIERLRSKWHELECEIIHFSTVGDRTQHEGKPLPEVGGKGLFTAELEEALRDGRIDLAVHSLKDLPVEVAEGLTLGAITSRADVRDVLIARNGWTLATLPHGAHVGTSSTRRAAQLCIHRPDLAISSIRGNVETRIRKVMSGEYDATLLALAGIERLQLNDLIGQILSLETMLPAPGQGALAVQCRDGDESVLHLLAAIDDPSARAATVAERAFLAALGGGCSAPVAAYAHFSEDGRFNLKALVATADGSQIIRVKDWLACDKAQLHPKSAEHFGIELAHKALSEGADQILAHSGMTQTAKPLLGKRIVITRRPEQSEELRTQLAALGATPISVPVIEIVPTEDWSRIDAAIGQLDLYDWLLFTSANAVDLFFLRMKRITTSTDRLPRIGCIGNSTANALREHGASAAFVPSAATADAIVAEVFNNPGTPPHPKVLLPQAAIARRNLVESLSAAGATVEALPIYDTVFAEPKVESLRELKNGADLIIFTSGSTARNFGELIRKHNLSPIMKTVPAVCIGPLTAREAQQEGFVHLFVAADTSNDGIIQAILTHYTTTHTGSNPNPVDSTGTTL